MESFDREHREIKETLFDLLIIGGGINGAGIARDAALRGFKVCLIEKGDFASGTSSKTSKLIHGGLRYLEHGHFKLVRESLQERHHLLKIAPHLVNRLSFLIPIYRTNAHSPFMLKLGLALYDLLAGKNKIANHNKLSFKNMCQDFPQIKRPGLHSALHYYDAQMNDARLCLENILSAIDQEAICLNYVQALELIEKDSKISGVLAQDLITQEKIEIRAKLTVNATGPWTDLLLKTTQKNIAPKLRLSKGIHLVLPQLVKDHALLLVTRQDRRAFFCIPWGEFSLVGTTDSDFSGSPDEVHAKTEEVQYLLDEVNRLFPQKHLSPKDIITTFAGLRPLVNRKGRFTSKISREYKIEESIPGLISVLGGKYTTYRSLAEEVVNKISKMLRLHEDTKSITSTTVLPGGAAAPSPQNLAQEYDIPVENALHLIQTYGSRATQVAQMAKDYGLKDRLCPNHPHIKAEVPFAFSHEFAQTLDDFLTRRTTIRFSSCRGLKCLETISSILAELSIHSDDELDIQMRQYREMVEKDLQCLNLEKPEVS